MYTRARGCAAPEGECRHSYVLGKSQMHMLHTYVCYVKFLALYIKICQNLPTDVLPLFITTGIAYDYGIFILTFL